MTAAQLLEELERRRIYVRLVGDKLRVSVVGGLDPDLHAELVAAKPELVAILREREAPIVFLDFETRSLVDLEVVGGRRYAEHASTEVLCAVFCMADGPIVTWTPPQPLPTAVDEAVTRGAALVAHNAFGFDKFVWEKLGWPPAAWIDTAHLAALRGLPRKLDALGDALLGRTKEREGARLVQKLSRVGRDGRLPEVTTAELARVIEYCTCDVLLLKDVWPALVGVCHAERELRELDTTINARGLCFDVELGRAIIECDKSIGAAVRDRTGVSDVIVRSHKKLLAALVAAGVNVSNIKRKTLEPLLVSGNLPDSARGLIEARIASSGIASSKVAAALERVSGDGRLRDTLVFHGAHTGRWTGKGFQPQNLPRGIRKFDIAQAVQAAKQRDVARLDELATSVSAKLHRVPAALVRACVIAPPDKLLVVADYASIEPRALAWFAGDTRKIEAFEKGQDIYKPMAAKLFSVPIEAVTSEQRNCAKPAELGCGYQLGGERLVQYAADMGIDWSKLPMTPDNVVEMWRNTNPRVAGWRAQRFERRQGGLWQRLEHAALVAARGDRIVVSCTTWHREGNDVVCVLPSGRNLYYCDARVELVPTQFGTKRSAMTYALYEDGHLVRKPVYGGLLTENVIQAICRDVLADALLRLEAARFYTVMHVHDEVVAEEDADRARARLEEMSELMKVAPSWAKGLPLAVEGYVSERYRGK